MANPRTNCFTVVRRKVVRSTRRKNITIIYNPARSDATSARQGTTSSDRTSITQGTDRTSITQATVSLSSSSSSLLTEDIAALRIQSFFRGCLARQAFRALKSLVKLQALVRGVIVRKQARVALHCMHALTRLQVKIRAQQLLSQCNAS